MCGPWKLPDRQRPATDSRLERGMRRRGDEINEKTDDRIVDWWSAAAATRGKTAKDARGKKRATSVADQKQLPSAHCRRRRMFSSLYTGMHVVRLHTYVEIDDDDVSAKLAGLRPLSVVRSRFSKQFYSIHTIKPITFYTFSALFLQNTEYISYGFIPIPKTCV